MPEVESQDTVESLLEELGGEVQSYNLVMPIRTDDLSVVAREGIPDDGSKRLIRWSVSRGGFVWTKNNEWEVEPQPSSRTDEFLQRARYDTLLQALQAAKRAKEHEEVRARELQRRHPESDRHPEG